MIGERHWNCGARRRHYNCQRKCYENARYVIFWWTLRSSHPCWQLQLSLDDTLEPGHVTAQPPWTAPLIITSHPTLQHTLWLSGRFHDTNVLTYNIAVITGIMQSEMTDLLMQGDGRQSRNTWAAREPRTSSIESDSAVTVLLFGMFVRGNNCLFPLLELHRMH